MTASRPPLAAWDGSSPEPVALAGWGARVPDRRHIACRRSGKSRPSSRRSMAPLPWWPLTVGSRRGEGHALRSRIGPELGGANGVGSRERKHRVPAAPQTAPDAWQVA
jgi:hypothetical protein